MIIANTRIKEKYPYWNANMEKQQEEQRINRIIEEAELRITQFVDMKMNEIEARIQEIENNVKQTKYNIEATLNNQTMDDSIIRREVKKMVLKEFEKALK